VTEFFERHTYAWLFTELVKTKNEVDFHLFNNEASFERTRLWMIENHPDLLL
jgi:hypothetical protein